MNDKFNLRNVNSTCSQVSGNNQLVRSIPEFDERPFPVFLFHSSIKQSVSNIMVVEKGHWHPE